MNVGGGFRSLKHSEYIRFDDETASIDDMEYDEDDSDDNV